MYQYPPCFLSTDTMNKVLPATQPPGPSCYVGRLTSPITGRSSPAGPGTVNDCPSGVHGASQKDSIDMLVSVLNLDIQYPVCLLKYEITVYILTVVYRYACSLISSELKLTCFYTASLHYSVMQSQSGHGKLKFIPAVSCRQTTWHTLCVIWSYRVTASTDPGIATPPSSPQSYSTPEISNRTPAIDLLRSNHLPAPLVPAMAHWYNNGILGIQCITIAECQSWFSPRCVWLFCV